ncbi:MAG: hypothetical protein V7642_3563 [Burkholderiales bacterium]
MYAQIFAGGLLPEPFLLLLPVVPAKAGIHKPVDIASSAWISAFAGMTVI